MIELNHFEPGSLQMLRDFDEFPGRDTPLRGFDLDIRFDSIYPPQYFPHPAPSFVMHPPGFGPRTSHRTATVRQSTLKRIPKRDPTTLREGEYSK